MRCHPRRPHSLLAATVSVAALLSLSACSSSDAPDSSGSTSTESPSADSTGTSTEGTSTASTAAGASGTAAPTTTVDAALTDPVGKFLISKLPNGFRVQDDDLANTGSADLTKAVEEDGADDAQSFLEGIGYQHGYRRIWATQDFGRTIYVSLDLLANEAGATAFCQRSAQNMRAKAPSSESFSVDGRPNAVGVRAGDASGSASAVFEVKGPWCIEVLAAGTNDVDKDVQRTQATELFLAQFDAVVL